MEPWCLNAPRLFDYFIWSKHSSPPLLCHSLVKRQFYRTLQNVTTWDLWAPYLWGANLHSGLAALCPLVPHPSLQPLFTCAPCSFVYFYAVLRLIAYLGVSGDCFSLCKEFLLLLLHQPKWIGYPGDDVTITFPTAYRKHWERRWGRREVQFRCREQLGMKEQHSHLRSLHFPQIHKRLSTCCRIVCWKMRGSTKDFSRFLVTTLI